MFLYSQITRSDISCVGWQPGDCRWPVDLPCGLCGYLWVNKGYLFDEGDPQPFLIPIKISTLTFKVLNF